MSELKKYQISYKETNLTILSRENHSEAIREELVSLYSQLERFMQNNPLFLSSYKPVPPAKDSPEIAKIMAHAAKKAGVGPMAAVAGTFSDLISRTLLQKGEEDVIVENGGDIFLRITKPRTVGIYAGPSQFSEKIGFRVVPGETPLGVCTSSNSVGPSISLGRSDAVTVTAPSSALADAAATAIGNAVRGRDPIRAGLKKAGEIEGINGALIIKGGRMGAWGKLPEIINL